MRVSLIGSFSGPRDEGMRNTNEQLRRYLSKRVELTVIEQRDLKRGPGLLRLRRSRPDVVHYLHGPTIRSLGLCRLARTVSRGSRVVILAANPAIDNRWDRLARWLRPDLALVVTEHGRRRLTGLGIRCKRVSLGVDQDVFSPLGTEERTALRKRLGLGKEKVVLHVGHLTGARGVDRLAILQRHLAGRAQIVIVASATNEPQQHTRRALEAAGVRIICTFQERIWEHYQAADAYVFPGLRADSAIDVPLSVLEAMATNLPVVTSRFGALPELFEAAPGFRFAATTEEMMNALDDLVFDTRETPTTREMIRPYTWYAFGKAVLDSYRQLCNSSV